MTPNNMSRRSFLEGLGMFGLGAAGAVGLAGCTSTQSTNNGKDTGETAPSAATRKQADETLQCDIVVLGSGMAGMSAALTAKDEGAGTVLILESQSVLGGNTNYAEGMFAVGSSLQKKMGITDISVESILDVEYEFQNYNVDTKWWETVATNSAGNIDWLMEKGVVFDTVTSTGSNVPLTWHIFEGDHGKSAIGYLEAAAKEAGIDIMPSTPATALIFDGMSVSGVQAEGSDGTVYDIEAKSVVIACGGCGAAPEMMTAYTNRDVNRAFYRGMPGEMGLGINMAASVSGDVPKNITVCQIGLTVPNTDIFSQLSACMSMEPTQMFVNQDAQRFVTEEVMNYYSKCGNAVQNQQTVFSVCDQSIMDHYMNEGCAIGFAMFVKAGTLCTNIPNDLDTYASLDDLYVADTLEELAKKTGLDAKALATTVSAYNDACAAGDDKAYGKNPSYLLPLQTGPFYAARVVPNILNTMGGIKINHDCQVINSSFEPVYNLYCAGMDASGFQGETYGISISGSCQGVAVCTGRIAGARATENAKKA